MTDKKTVIMDSAAMGKTLSRLAHEIVERRGDEPGLAIVGIKTRGAYIAARLADKVSELAGKKIERGYLGITLYRDDLSQQSEQPLMHSTEVDFDVQGRTIILADDVLYTGRTVRCALDALIDLGRPARIELAVLVDRGHRELPIRADYAGKNIPTAKSELVRVRMKECDGADEVVVERK
ncbi:MAG: bifunctional pyr operon transcriptional regulator/uracil phosphoribosyltransferase PyrR [Elusimicrobiales bacterium]|nr:bifunctional pyr operon transcriptional regulator/uracil phosphoribosyltransferase PyrR [Elusimicrobiales bacterium]